MASTRGVVRLVASRRQQSCDNKLRSLTALVQCRFHHKRARLAVSSNQAIIIQDAFRINGAALSPAKCWECVSGPRDASVELVTYPRSLDVGSDTSSQACIDVQYTLLERGKKY